MHARPPIPVLLPHAPSISRVTDVPRAPWVRAIADPPREYVALAYCDASCNGITEGATGFITEAIGPLRLLGT
eukprot:413419-Pyramimonas_sp.AAC.1